MEARGTVSIIVPLLDTKQIQSSEIIHPTNIMR